MGYHSYLVAACPAHRLNVRVDVGVVGIAPETCPFDLRVLLAQCLNVRKERFLHGRSVICKCCIYLDVLGSKEFSAAAVPGRALVLPFHIHAEGSEGRTS